MAKREIKRPRVSKTAAITASKTLGSFFEGDENVNAKEAKAALTMMKRFVVERIKAAEKIASKKR